MLTTERGRTLLAAFAQFWFLRMIEPAFVFEMKGWLSVVFTIIFLLGSIFYLVPLLFPIAALQ